MHPDGTTASKNVEWGAIAMSGALMADARSPITRIQWNPPAKNRLRQRSSTIILRRLWRKICKRVR
jgi:hypothetical protein